MIDWIVTEKRTERAASKTKARKAGLSINDLIREAWQIYKQYENQPFLVKPSIPILFFGDSNKYFSSKLRVITLGLNPSRVEFPEENRFKRFERAREVHRRIPEKEFYEEYLEAINGYFRKPPNYPYERWFNSFEQMLVGLDCSYHFIQTSAHHWRPTRHGANSRAKHSLALCDVAIRCGTLLSNGYPPTS